MNFDEVGARGLALIAKYRPGDVYSSPGLGYHASDNPRSASRIMALTINWLYQRGDARDYFLGVLRSFAMSDKERKIIERAARTFNLRRAKSPVKLPETGWMEKYARFFDELEAMYRVAIAIVNRGEACRDEQFCTARCFRLVNTGGYPVATMQAVQKVVDEAARILDEAGFGYLCYGDVYVTQTVAKSARILAFYVGSDDMMYVRANLKGVEGAALHTILHEIGHRLDNKFTSPTIRANVGMLFRSYKRAVKDLPEVVGGAEPKLGDEFVYKNEKFHVTKIDGYRNHVHLTHHEEPGVRISMSLDTWRLRHGGREQRGVGPFPTHYSATSASEFFAEMFSFLLTNSLSAERVADFAPLLEPLRRREPGMTRGRSPRRGGLARGRRGT